MARVLLTLFLLAGAVSMAAPAQAACTEIATLPATISTPGRYCLAANHAVYLPSGSAISIAASNVVLDCRHHSIRNQALTFAGTSSGVGFTGRSRVTVRNCRLLGRFATGIHAFQDNNAANANTHITLADNTIIGAAANGILAFGTAIEIRGNRIHEVGGQLNSWSIGIRLGGSSVAGQRSLHVLRDNVIAGTVTANGNAYGIYSSNSYAGLFTGNIVTGTDATFPEYYNSAGMFLNALHSRVSGNHVTGSGAANHAYGIYSWNSNTLCFDNYVHGAVTATSGCDATLGNY